MSVSIRFFGMMRSIVGADEVEANPSGDTLQDLIDFISAQYGSAVKNELLDKEGNLDLSYAIFIGGQRAQSLAAKIHDGDEVVFTTGLAGGSQ